MKQRLNGLRFKTWGYMTLFSIAILLLIWVFQVIFLKPFYRNSRIGDVRYVASVIEDNLRNETLSEGVVGVVIQNNVCASVYNQQGEQVYFVDTLGVNCFISRQNHQENPNFMQEYIEQAKIVRGTDFYFNLTGADQEREMMFYGKEVVADFTSYFVFVNAPIEPLDSTIKILQDQFGYVTIGVFVLSTFVALMIASRLSKPLQAMVKSAKKLAGGDVKVEFEPTNYTEFNELAQTLNYATQEIAKMDDLRKDLIANVSHDIKTPLTTIKAYAEMIKEISGSSETKRNEHLDIILMEAQHLDVLVSDMLKLSQFNQPSLLINATNVHLKSMIENIVRLFDNASKSFNIEITTKVDEAMIVYCDEVKVGQVIFNYINNAISHAGPDQHVFIEAAHKKDVIRVSVIDHGDGIAKADLPYLWDRYYKIDKNFTRNDSGSGLGLAIVKSICLAHNLNFGVTSTVDETRFYVDLPMEAQAEVLL